MNNHSEPDPSREERQYSGNDPEIDLIVHQTLFGSLYKIGGQAITLVLGFTRSIILARILFPDDFGIVALALFFVNLAATFAGFGLNATLIRKENIDQASISTHFIIRCSLSIINLILMFICTPIFNLFYPQRTSLIPIILTLSVIEIVKAISSTPNVLLIRKFDFKRLAVLDVLSSGVMLPTATYLAMKGWGPWSLVLGEQLAGALISALGVWIYRPPWKPSFHFDWGLARQYFSFGKFIVLNLQIDYLLDQFDDFWTASKLGSTAAGYYTKAYEFARYPRRVLSMPLQPVIYSSFSRLKTDRQKLSNAFTQITGLMVRIGFLLSLVFVLIAPEMVLFLLTDKWSPMVKTFQLMIIYTLIDPIIMIAGNLILALGYPHIHTRIKLIQLIFFIPAVVLLASLWGIEGVAVAANLMLVIGIILLFHSLRMLVDFSLKEIYGHPSIALLIGLATGIFASYFSGNIDPWISVILKASSSGFAYLVVLLSFEYRTIRQQMKTLINMIRLSQLKKDATT